MRTISSRILLVTASVVIAFSAIEILVRLLGLFPDYDYPKGFFRSDELLTYSMTPNFHGKLVKQEFTTDISTNSLGLRDWEYGEKKENPVMLKVMKLSEG